VEPLPFTTIQTKRLELLAKDSTVLGTLALEIPMAAVLVVVLVVLQQAEVAAIAFLLVLE
jgi:hypothetical protein